MKPLVSILIPAFNARSTLRDTLRSALDQTWNPKEIIVVDDGSADDTAAVAREFAPEGVIVLTQPHGGASSARNTAFSASSGNYVQWLDADDILAPDKTELQMRALDRCSDRAVLSSAWGRFWHRTSKAQFKPTGLWSDLAPLEWLLRRMEKDVYMQTATWIVPRPLAEAAGPWDTRLVWDDDGEFFCRVLLLSDQICFVPAAKVFYRVSGSQRISYIGDSQAKMEAKLLSIRLQIGYLMASHDSARTRRACVQYLQNALITFYPGRPDLVSAARGVARGLGGELQDPRFAGKYAWMAAAFGPRFAKRAQAILPWIRWSALVGWDKAMHSLERLTRVP